MGISYLVLARRRPAGVGLREECSMLDGAWSASIVSSTGVNRAETYRVVLKHTPSALGITRCICHEPHRSLIAWLPGVNAIAQHARLTGCLTGPRGYRVPREGLVLDEPEKDLGRAGAVLRAGVLGLCRGAK